MGGVSKPTVAKPAVVIAEIILVPFFAKEHKRINTMKGIKRGDCSQKIGNIHRMSGNFHGKASQEEDGLCGSPKTKVHD